MVDWVLVAVPHFWTSIAFNVWSPTFKFLVFWFRLWAWWKWKLYHFCWIIAHLNKCTRHSCITPNPLLYFPICFSLSVAYFTHNGFLASWESARRTIITTVQFPQVNQPNSNEGLQWTWLLRTQSTFYRFSWGDEASLGYCFVLELAHW